MSKIIFPLILFSSLTFFVITGQTLHFDQTFSQAIYSLRQPPATSILIFITTFFDTTPLITFSLLIFIYLSYRRSPLAFPFLLTMALGALINAQFKTIFAIPRPDISPLLPTSDPSYPSGHAMNNLVFWSLINFHLLPRRRLLLLFSIILVTLIGFSRIYLGVHYPSDVLGGYLWGILWYQVSVNLFFKKQQ